MGDTGTSRAVGALLRSVAKEKNFSFGFLRYAEPSVRFAHSTGSRAPWVATKIKRGLSTSPYFGGDTGTRTLDPLLAKQVL